MSSLQARLCWGGIFLLLAVGLVFSIGQAQPAADVAVDSLIPANPVLYARWDGGDAHQEAWEQTAAYDAIYKTGLIDVFRKLVQFAGEQAGPGGEFGVIKQVVEKIGAHGFSFAVSVQSDFPPKPQGIAVLHDAAELEHPGPDDHGRDGRRS